MHIVATRGESYTNVLLQAGAEVDKTNASLGTALQWAADDGMLKVVKLLVENGADVNAKAGFKGTALMAATRSKRMDLVVFLMDHGANPNEPDLHRFGSPLSLSFDVGLEMMQLLINFGASVQKQFRDVHVLVKAVRAENREAVKLLLQHGADANMTHQRVSMLGWTIRLRNLDIAMDLVEGGANLEPEDATRLLELAISQGDAKTVQSLLYQAVDPNSIEYASGPALVQAAIAGREDLLRLLLNSGADINARHSVHGSAILAALQAGRREIAEFLLRSGANVPDLHNWNSLPTISPHLRLWKSIALNTSYSSWESFVADFDDSGGKIPITRLEFPWHIPSLLTEEQECGASPERILEMHLALVRWQAVDASGETVLRTEATTCLAFIKRRWGTFGCQILRDLSALCDHDGKTEFLRCEYSLSRLLFCQFAHFHSVQGRWRAFDLAQVSTTYRERDSGCGSQLL